MTAFLEAAASRSSCVAIIAGTARVCRLVFYPKPGSPAPAKVFYGGRHYRIPTADIIELLTTTTEVPDGPHP